IHDFAVDARRRQREPATRSVVEERAEAEREAPAERIRGDGEGAEPEVPIEPGEVPGEARGEASDERPVLIEDMEQRGGDLERVEPVGRLGRRRARVVEDLPTVGQAEG